MYGIVNQAIKSHIISTYGEDKWEAVKKRIDSSIDFVSNEQPYNDDTTYHLAQAVADEMQLPIDKVLLDFGESVTKIITQNVQGYMDSRGDNLKEYLINLPNFHNRMMLIYPALTPPEFQISNIKENSINLHYISKTEGIRAFIKGYLTGLVHFFNEKVTIEPLELSNEESKQEVFKISW